MLATVRLMADAHKERVGAAIRERRDELDLSQAALAAKIPVAEKTLRRWENGESFGHMDNLERLAEALETTVDKLMAGPEKAKGQTPDLLGSVNGDVPDDLRQQVQDLHAKVDRIIDALGLDKDADQHPLDQISDLASALPSLLAGNAEEAATTESPPAGS
jgi:transcriptional regulator with XRE-family HTH domain